ncbi:hypothetical protein BDR26DRAFT_170220 [Obelidium mucronatum]|nr:hypothetical protein BDR26DRAFT_170220 [Obelidium mucronatum]
MAEGVATGLLNPYTLKPYSKDEEFAYNITVPPPSAPKPNKIQEKHQPIDLSSSSRILQTSITVSSNMNHSQLQHKLVTTSSASQYFPKPVSSILSLEPDVFQTPSPPESQSAFLNNISDADSCLESKPIHFSSSQFAKFINTTVSISDGFSYHQTAIRPHGKSEAIASCESENQSENKSPSPQSLKIFPHEPLLDPTHLGTSIQTRTLHSVSVSQEEECRFENACESNDKQRYQAEAEAANTSGSEKLTYMEWNYNYRPPTHSSQTRDYVGKSVVGSGLNHFKSRTQEQSLYSAAVGSVKRPLAGGGSGQKKRLGTGRPKNTSSIKDFFGKKG